MSKEIKCPICQGVSTLRYNENRTYMSHCHDINCFKLVTVTAPSESVAEELFSKFEKGTSQPELSIPKKIADKLDNEDANSKAVLDWVFATEMIVVNNEKALERREDEILKRRAIVSIYGASKALGVELVEVTDE